MNKVCFEIDNCCDCPYHYTERVYTPDPWEHETGVYCSKLEDKRWRRWKKMIKYANQIIKEIKERGHIQVSNGYVTGEEFEKWLRDRNINLTREEIVEDCEGILNMLNGEE